MKREENENAADENTESRPSRRDFLKGMGSAGAGIAAASLGVDTAAAATKHKPYRPPHHGGYHHPGHPPTPPGHGAPPVPGTTSNFGRLFPKLKPFAQPTDEVRAALVEVGKQGGIMDAKDELGAGPKALIVTAGVNGNPTVTDVEATPAELYGTNPDNTTMTAGTTFIGQFTDHDITFDQTSLLGQPADPNRSPNTRTPALDLDSVFGGGPAVRPDLYEPNPDGTVGPKMKIGTGGVHEDIPRIANGDGSYSAVIADPRNDENLQVAGLHTAHILFYNRVLEDMKHLDLSVSPLTKGCDTRQRNTAFTVARLFTQWHYQWLLVNEHLPQICGQAPVEEVLKQGCVHYRPAIGQSFMPVEFSAAAYRFGHSMVRPSYRANFTSGTGDSTNPAANPFFALVFDPKEPSFSGPITTDRGDLLGGFPAKRRYIGWQTFFDLGDAQVKPNKKVDPLVSSILFTLPLPAIAPHTESAPLVLPQRNLLRQLTWGMPSGQAVAAELHVAPLASADLADIAGIYKPFGTSTPLWYYILAESKVVTNGITLGPVGAKIVAETLIGLLRADPNSYLNANPHFTPSLGTDLKMGPTPSQTITGTKTYTRAHFLHYARVVESGLYR